jgi:cytochrome c556
MKMKTISLALAAIVGAAAALAHSGATGVVKERMEAMDAMADAVKRIAPMFQGELSYDADAVRNAAAIMRSHGGRAMTDLFPEGSNGAPSEAKDAIWISWDEFTVLADRLGIYAEGLSLAAENGLSTEALGADAMMGGATMMGSSAMMGAEPGMGAMMSGREPMMGVEELAGMPADMVFEMVSQTCSACHTRFRADK